MVQEDKILVGVIEGKMKGYMAAIELGKFEEQKLLTKTNEILSRKEEMLRKFKEIETLKKELDSDEIQQTDIWQVTTVEGDNLEHTFKLPYDFEPICAVTRGIGVDFPYSMKPMCIANMYILNVCILVTCVGGQARVVTYSKKRDIYKEEIKKLLEKEQMIRKEITVLEEEEKQLVPKNERTASELQKLRGYMAKCYKDLNGLLLSTIPLELARERLEKIERVKFQSQ